MSSLIFGIDIEAGGLKGDFAQVFTVGLQRINSDNPGSLEYEPEMFGIQHYVTPPTCKYRHPVKDGHLPVYDDTPLLKAVWERLSEADMLVGWYSKGYDVKFLNTRGVFNGLPPLPPIAHVDLYYTAKGNFTLSSNRLAAWAEFLGLEQKTPLLRATWRAAANGDPAALAYVTEHCKVDVKLLDGVYARLRPFVRLHPRVEGADLSLCRYCGSPRLQKRGKQLTSQKLTQQRVQCQKCGAWDKRLEREIEQLGL